MDLLMALVARCKGSVDLEVNGHRDYYDTPQQRLDWYASLECPPEISDEVKAGILSTGNIVDLKFYPLSPIGFHRIVHFDIDEALKQAIAELDARGIGVQAPSA